MIENPKIEQLPKDWKLVKLGDTIDIQGGSQPPKSDFIYQPKEGYIQLLQIRDFGDKGVPTYVPIKKVTKFCKKDDIMIARYGASLGRIITGLEGAYNVALAKVIDENKLFEKRYIFYLLKTQIFQTPLKLLSRSAQNGFSKSELAHIELPLPPKPTQQDIVSKIEELLSELDKGVEQLKTAQLQLKTYRQAVLKWAFEGKLTNKNVKENELPKEWRCINLGDYIEDISSGKSFRCNERPPQKDEVGIVKVSSVTWGFFDESESKTCFTKDLLNTNYLIKQGDFLFSRANTIELIGACVIVNKITNQLMLSDKILRFTFTKDVSKEFVLYYLRSRRGRKQIEALSTGNQDSMRNIGQVKVRQIQIPVCSTQEQNKVVQEIESRLSVADKMDGSITESLLQAETLRQSILKKAFEGKLTS